MQTIGQLATTTVNNLPTRKKEKTGSLVAYHENTKAYWMSRWPTGKTFLTRLNCDAGLWLRNNPHKVYIYDFPTLAQVEDMYGCANLWLETQYTQFLMQLSQRVMPTETQINEGVKVMRTVFSAYTTAEILLFFAKLRTGDFVCYNRGNVQELCEIFNQKFLPLRAILIDEAAIEREKRKQATAEKRKTELWNKAVELGLTEIDAPADQTAIRQWLDTLPNDIMRETLEYLYTKKFNN